MREKRWQVDIIRRGGVEQPMTQVAQRTISKASPKTGRPAGMSRDDREEETR